MPSRRITVEGAHGCTGDRYKDESVQYGTNENGKPDLTPGSPAWCAAGFIEIAFIA
ncbi:MAG: hypothetical protein VW877_02330 [Pseudomonadaceae bacterium]